MPGEHTIGTTPLLIRNCLPSSSKSDTDIEEDEKQKKRNKSRTKVHPYGDPFVNKDNASHPDIAAMSVLSLYEIENEQSCSEMDTNRWVFASSFVLLQLKLQSLNP